MKETRLTALLLTAFAANLISSATNIKKLTLHGNISDAALHQPMAYANVQLFADGQYLAGQQTGNDGSFKFGGLADGRYRLRVSYIGYETTDTLLYIKDNTSCSLKMRSSAKSIDEVVVTAAERRGLTSTTVIDRTAMRHLQPSSFSDLLSLLPGGMTSTPHTNVANVARLREVGISDANYAVSSLGTKFVVDGAPLGTDANMQAMPEGTDADNRRNHTAYGIDMRNISTDNIESVEIVRGIPSVKYGELTSGLINIRRRHTASPLEIRLKADEYGQLVSAGKGFNLAGNWLLNVDGGLFASKADPRNKFETYNRLNFSARLHKLWNLKGGSHLYWDVSADYSGNMDNVKTDPEVQIHLEDKYKSAYHHGAINGSLRLYPKEGGWLHSLSVDYSASLSVDNIDQTKFVSVDRDTHAPLKEENGEYDGTYLPSTYITRYQVKGLPFYSNLRVEADMRLTTGTVKHILTAGGEWQYNKNYGDGEVYDYQRPIGGSTARRPRAFKDIPATDIVAAYAQDEASMGIGRHKLTAMLGIRATTMAGIGKDFDMHGKAYVDPRLNMQWDLPAMGKLHAYISAGWGRMSKMPTITDLYPEKLYLDFVQLNYWNKNDAYKRVNLRTYTIDTNNRALRPAHNNKLEARAGGQCAGHSFYVAFFNERMSDGFRSSARVVPMLTYKRYDTSGIDGSALTAPPSLSDLPYRTDTIMRTYNAMDNGTRIIKEGVEWQYSTPRIKWVNTRFTVNGAWFHTSYSNSQPEFYAGARQQVNGVTINNRYIGLYEWRNGYVMDQVTTNIIADTYLDRLGLIFSATAECFWMGKTRTPSRKARPIAYIDVNGNMHSYTDADASDMYLSWLTLTNQQDNGDVRRDRAYACFNFKATKRLGRNASLSFFADRLLSIAPDYEVNGFVVRRVFSPYFGMELNLKI